jgi:hypothetical protein
MVTKTQETTITELSSKEMTTGVLNYKRKIQPHAWFIFIDKNHMNNINSDYTKSHFLLKPSCTSHFLCMYHLNKLNFNFARENACESI